MLDINKLKGLKTAGQHLDEKLARHIEMIKRKNE